MSRIKETLADLERYIAELELENAKNQEKVNQLLEESDVKSLPSYKLLLCKYGQPKEIEVDTAQESQHKIAVREVLLPVVTEESIKDLVYQSIYEPPRLRYTNKKKPVAEGPVTNVASKKSTASAPVLAPAATAFPLAPAPTVVLKPSGMLYQVELNKVKYYIHSNRLFDMVRLEPVGYIASDGFVFDTGEFIPIKQEPSLVTMDAEGYSDYLKDSMDVVYQRIGAGVCHGIGTYCAGDINLWVPEDEQEAVERVERVESDDFSTCLF